MEKKKILIKPLQYLRSAINKKYLIILIIIFQFSFTFAQTGILEQEIMLEMKETTVKGVLNEISEKSGIKFSYSNEINVNKKVTISLKKASVNTYLNKIFSGDNVKFIVKENKIIIVKENRQSNRYTQTIKGFVIDEDTKTSLPFATVVLLNTDPVIGTNTDETGFFYIKDVPSGRYSIKVSFLGYKDKIIPGVNVNTGKETIIKASLESLTEELNEVVVTPDFDKTRSLNNMSTVSARSFSVEETRRFAGGLDDPARMASSFAGVATGGYVENNAIIIRGNASKGILWRLEGVEIINPNHFAGLDYTGAGAVTIFSAQMLDNSDFFTGAFPAEFGNATSGVFDIKFRTGNNEKREYTFQAGFLGLDFAAEGPFKKGGKASYLMNYRYSSLGIIKNFINTRQMPVYQDLSIKLNFPTSKYGVFSLWGLGGYDNTTKPEVADPEKWETFEDRHRTTQKIGNAAFGLNHKIILGNRTYLNSSIASTFIHTNDLDEFYMNFLYFKNVDLIKQTEGKLTGTVNINHKSGKRHTNKTGIIYNKLFYDIDIQYAPNSLDPLTQFVKENGYSDFFQAYTQSKYHISDKLLLNLGLHSHYFTYNGNYSLEPRAGLRWNFAKNHTAGLAYGLHSRLEELKIYFVRNENNNPVTFPNKDLKLMKSHHYVFSYEWQFNHNLFMKIEPYYQQLFDVPVIENTSYSFINYTNERYFNDSVANNGSAVNMGIDITFERFLSNDFYWLITASVFDSKYKGGDDIERNSRYNRNFVLNALVGKEYYIGKNKQNIFGINGRLNLAGGTRYIPVHEEYTRLTQRLIFDYDKAYDAQWPYKLNMDLTLTYRRNKANLSSVWALQIVNLFGSKSYYGHIYNYAKNKVEEDLAQFVLPILSYKIEF